MDKEIKNRKGLVIRIRTITLTLLVIFVLALYLLVQTFFRDEISWIDFIVLTTVTIVIHCVYFPDGELNGQRDERYVANNIAYNVKAELINAKRQIFNLNEYCKVDFDTRKKSYIETNCGYLEITPEILEYFRDNYSEKDLKKREYLFVDETETKKYFLSKHKRKILRSLLFKELPIGYNFPDTILSAKETDSSKAIEDGSKKFKFVSYSTKIATAIILGLVLAYIGLTKKDGFTIADLCKMIMYLTSIVATAVFSYSNGEKSMKIFKCDFYIQLCNFIERFFVWLLEEKRIDINTYTYENKRDVVTQDDVSIKLLKNENKDV